MKRTIAVILSLLMTLCCLFSQVCVAEAVQTTAAVSTSVISTGESLYE